MKRVEQDEGEQLVWALAWEALPLGTALSPKRTCMKGDPQTSSAFVLLKLHFK